METRSYTRKFKNVKVFDGPLVVDGSGTLGISVESALHANLPNTVRMVAHAMSNKLYWFKGEWDGPLLCNGVPVSKEDQQIADSVHEELVNECERLQAVKARAT